jgi:hypothetical protein
MNMKSSYIVLVAGFYFSPNVGDQVDATHKDTNSTIGSLSLGQTALFFFSSLWGR